MFGQNITLNLLNNSDYKTIFGGVSSICIYIMVTVLLFNKTKSMIYKEDINVTTIKSMDSNPKGIDLSKASFMFALSIQQFGMPYNQVPFFQVEVEKRKYLRDSGGQIDKRKHLIDLEPCSLEHWSYIRDSKNQSFMSKELQKEFELIGLQHWLCPKLSEVFSLQGSYSSQEFDFVKFKIVQCQEGNAGFPSWHGYRCGTQKELEEHLQRQGNFIFQLYTSNFQLNAQSEKVDEPFLFSDLHFSFIPKQKFKNVEIFVEDVQVETNNSILFYIEDIVVKNYPLIQLSEVREESDTNVDGSKGLSQFYFRRSNSSTLIKRSFISLFDLVSYMGGFFQVIFSLVGLFVIAVNRQSQLITMANNLYTIEYDPSKGCGKQAINSNNNNKKQRLPKQRTSAGKHLEGAEDTSSPYKKLLRRQTIKNDFFDIVKKRSQDLKLSAEYFIYELSCRRLFATKHNEMINKCKDLVDKQIDIIQMLGKLHELDKLKTVLFTSGQLCLFNYSPKPKLTYENLFAKGGNEAGDQEYISQQIRSRIDIANSMQDPNSKVWKSSIDGNNKALLRKRRTINQNFRQKVNMKFSTYLVVIKAKAKFLRLLRKNRQCQNRESYEELIEAYNQVRAKQSIAKEQSSAPFQESINNKLIQYLGKEMVNFLNSSNMLSKVPAKEVAVFCKSLNIKENQFQEDEDLKQQEKDQKQEIDTVENKSQKLQNDNFSTENIESPVINRRQNIPENKNNTNINKELNGDDDHIIYKSNSINRNIDNNLLLLNNSNSIRQDSNFNQMENIKSPPNDYEMINLFSENNLFENKIEQSMDSRNFSPYISKSKKEQQSLKKRYSNNHRKKSSVIKYMLEPSYLQTFQTLETKHDEESDRRQLKNSDRQHLSFNILSPKHQDFQNIITEGSSTQR